MLAVLGAAGGAAICRLIERLHHREGQVQELERRIERVQEQESALRQLVGTLEQDRGTQAAAHEQLHVAIRRAEELQASVEELQHAQEASQWDNASLKAALHQQQQHAEEQRDMLHAEKLQKDLLEAQVQQMREQHQQELATYQKQLDLLRTRVSEIVSRLLNNSVSKADAADFISALGCHVTYLESDVAAPETQPQLVMEDRQRLQRLVASGMLRTGGSQALPYRIPLVTFPSMRQPSSGGSIASKPSFTNPTSDKENQPKPCLPAGDVNTKDQAPASSASAARSKTAPHISLAHTKQFEYSVQGKQGSQYIARVPLTASQPSGLALLASGGLASALHWAPEAAAQGLGPQPDTWCTRAVLADPLESLDQQLVSRHLQSHILVRKATWNALWEEYLKPRWRQQRLGLHNAQERVNEGFCKKRVGESMQRPLQLCSCEGLEALPPIGTEYQQGYKGVNDRLPKGMQRLHRAAEYRRGIDGRARNNA
ncbi:hypothetical protein QJQ45_005705 [Haematococcus lacustris]|nr:hypothetical protein QJQ45_005705 [Haematococcus lacustris]